VFNLKWLLKNSSKVLAFGSVFFGEAIN